MIKTGGPKVCHSFSQRVEINIFIVTICLTCQINLKKIVFAHRKRKIYDRNYDLNSKQCIDKI